MIISWPSVIKEKRVTDHVSAFWDFLPTMADMLGDKVETDIDGISYLPTIMNNKDAQKEHEYIYYEFYEQGGKQSILKDGWKLVRLNLSKPGKERNELYYLPKDGGERNDLSAKYPEKVEELKKLAMSVRTESKNFKWKNKQ